MNYLIRPLEEKDISSVIEGETKAFGSSLGYELIYSDLTLNPYAYHFVLEINNRVSGYIGFWLTDETADIINFYIDSKCQGLGFGEMLLDFVIELCINSRVKNISLEVRKTNEKALGLYKKKGFVFSRIRENYYSDGEDAFVLIKELEVK